MKKKDFENTNSVVRNSCRNFDWNGTTAQSCLGKSKNINCIKPTFSKKEHVNELFGLLILLVLDIVAYMLCMPHVFASCCGGAHF